MSVGKTLVGLGTVAAVGVPAGLYMGGVIDPFPGEILWRSLSEDKDYLTASTVSSDYKGKYGETYSKYLVGVGEAKTDAEPSSNDDWWKWSYENRYLKNNTGLKDKFSTVKQAVGNDASNPSLKSICKAAYKDTIESGSSGNIKTEITSGGTDKFLERNIWLFCSPAEAKIATISDKTGSSEYSANSSTYGDTEQNKKILVSVESDSKGNTWFWNQKEKKLQESDKTTLGNKSVKEWCRAIYKQGSSPGNDSNLSKENLFKYCSLSGTAPTTTASTG